MIFVHKDPISRIAGDLLAVKFPSKIKEINYLSECIEYLVKLNYKEKVFFVGFNPKGYLKVSEYLNEYLFIYPYDDNGKNEQGKNVLSIVEELTGTTALIRADNYVSFSKLYHDVEYYDMAQIDLTAFQSMIAIFKSGFSSSIVDAGKGLYEYEPLKKMNIQEYLEENPSDYTWALLKGHKTLIIPEEFDYLAFRKLAYESGSDALMQLKFSVKGKSVAKFVVKPTKNVSSFVNYLKEHGFKNIKVNNNSGYALMDFNWLNILQYKEG